MKLMWGEDHDPQTLATSLIGRARALEQLAEFVERLPAFRRRTRRQRDYIASEMRLEAARARRDIRDAQRIGERKMQLKLDRLEFETGLDLRKAYAVIFRDRYENDEETIVGVALTREGADALRLRAIRRVSVNLPTDDPAWYIEKVELVQ